MNRRIDGYQEIINQHLPLIERQCFKAVRMQLKSTSYPNNGESLLVNIENEALSLSNQVLDVLQRENYRVLRQFKGDAKLSTYITAIIARQAVDMVRKKLGRNREKERAQKFGVLGIKIHEYLYVQGCSIAEIQTRLAKEAGFNSSLSDLQEIIDKIRGHRLEPGNLDGDSPVKEGTSRYSHQDGSTEEETELIIADTHSDPGKLLIEAQRQEKVRVAVKTLIDCLNGEERLLLKMRFPVAEEEKPGSVGKIAALLNITEKAAYKRIARVLKKCQDLLAQQGVSRDDLL